MTELKGLTTDTSPSEKVWRYMSFGRFVWLIQSKRLWLSRADLLGDPWEISLAGNQLAHVIAHHPPVTLPLPKTKPESVLQRSERIIKMWRQRTFVNCWCASKHESHALWRIYCFTREGIAIQTTLSTLKCSVGDLPVYPVTYEEPGARRQTPSLPDLVSKKRPMFAYEQEVRVVLSNVESESPQEEEPLGRSIGWNPEEYVETIFVHPEADSAFRDTVIAVVEQFAPKLKDRITWSAMAALPPF